MLFTVQSLLLIGRLITCTASPWGPSAAQLLTPHFNVSKLLKVTAHINASHVQHSDHPECSAAMYLLFRLRLDPFFESKAHLFLLEGPFPLKRQKFTYSGVVLCIKTLVLLPTDNSTVKNKLHLSFVYFWCLSVCSSLFSFLPVSFGLYWCLVVSTVISHSLLVFTAVYQSLLLFCGLYWSPLVSTDLLWSFLTTNLYRSPW